MSALAVPVTYVITADAVGSLDGTDFAAAIALTGRADTDDITTFSQGFIVPNESLAIDVSGVASAVFTNQTQTVSNQFMFQPIGGFGDVDFNRAILGVHSQDFLTYDLNGDFGPVAGDAAHNGVSVSFATSAGLLFFTSVTNAVFQAVVVPEPATALLVALGLVGLSVSRRTAIPTHLIPPSRASSRAPTRR